MKTFSKTFMVRHRGCYDIPKLYNCSFMANEEITLLDIIESEIPLADKFWFVCKSVANKKENRQIALQCAEIVLPVFEIDYPKNKTVKKAIEATKKYLAGNKQVCLESHKNSISLFLRINNSLSTSETFAQIAASSVYVAICAVISKGYFSTDNHAYTACLYAIEAANHSCEYSTKLIQVLKDYANNS